MKQSALVAWALAAAAAPACATAPPPSVRAGEVERIQCDSESAGVNEVHVLQTASVVRVEPLYSHVLTGNNGAEERVDGVKLLIRPPEGVTPERMTRILQCHDARALLGKVDRSAFPDDPFWLPGTWVSVEVRAESGNYAVILEADDVTTNLRLAERAKIFAQAHPLPLPSVQ